VGNYYSGAVTKLLSNIQSNTALALRVKTRVEFVKHKQFGPAQQYSAKQ